MVRANGKAIGREVLLFGHILKTAGITLRSILWQVYGSERVLIIEDPGELSRLLAVARERLAPGAGEGAREGEGGAAPELRAIETHPGYGIQQELPPGPVYRPLTLLREPIARTVSLYYYFRQQGRLEPGTSLERFVRTHPRGVWNWQTAFLGGLALACLREGRQPAEEEFDQELFHRALANLRSHAAVGLTERFDESVLLFARTFGWPRGRTLYVRRNVGRLKPGEIALTRREEELLRRRNELDLELYAAAQTLFRKQLSLAVPRAEQALRWYRRANRVYGRVFPVVRPLVRPVARGLRAVVRP